MKERLKRKTLVVAAALLAALLSMFVLSKIASSAGFHKETLASLQEKQTTVLQLTASAAAASTAITLIPGDAATPIADKMADVSSCFLLVLCAIFLEKYLLTITGTITFSVLIPLSCLLAVLYVLLDLKSLRALAIKLTVFGLLIFAVTPASVTVSNMIEDTYQTSIAATLDSAKDVTAEIEENAQDEKDDEGFWSGLVSSVTSGVTNIVDKAGKMVNHFVEALAIMLVTCCVIPILVVFAFLWIAKLIFSVDLPVNYAKLHRGVKGALPAAALKDTQ